MLDLAVEEDLETMFAIRRKIAERERAVIEQLVDHPMLMAGSSDGGAHLLTFCGADYTTRLITDWVPSRLTLEQAVAKLTFVPAMSMGLWDRGLIRPGMAGDLAIFEPIAWVSAQSACNATSPQARFAVGVPRRGLSRDDRQR
jgi:N-acyl-D-aspartate/D-glutamate deacylase